MVNLETDGITQLKSKGQPVFSGRSPNAQDPAKIRVLAVTVVQF